VLESSWTLLDEKGKRTKKKKRKRRKRKKKRINNISPWCNKRKN
jgi:hypothetical protein